MRQRFVCFQRIWEHSGDVAKQVVMYKHFKLLWASSAKIVTTAPWGVFELIEQETPSNYWSLEYNFVYDTNERYQ